MKTKTKGQLVAENEALRQQVAVYSASVHDYRLRSALREGQIEVEQGRIRHVPTTYMPLLQAAKDMAIRSRLVVQVLP